MLDKPLNIWGIYAPTNAKNSGKTPTGIQPIPRT